MARSLNKVQLIGNLTREPEVRYTGKGTAVATFSIATNREWTQDGEKKDDVEFHRIVAWDKLGEICGQYLKKGSKVFVEGRIQSRKWQTKEGEDRTTFEIVISEMLMLDSKGSTSDYSGPEDNSDYDVPDDFDSDDKSGSKTEKKSKKESKQKNEEGDSDDDIPF